MSDWFRLTLAACVLVLLFTLGAATAAMACEHHASPRSEARPVELPIAVMLLSVSLLMAYVILRRR